MQYITEAKLAEMLRWAEGRPMGGDAVVTKADISCALSELHAMNEALKANNLKIVGTSVVRPAGDG